MATFSSGENAKRRAVEQIERLLRVLAREAPQADRNDVGHRRAGRREAFRLAKHLRFLRHVDHQLPLALQRRQTFHQEAGDPVIAALHGQLGALPAPVFGQETLGFPELEQRVAGVVLRLADQPQPLGRGVSARETVAQLILREQAVQFGEVHLRIVIAGKGLPVAAGGQQAQPAQLHPVDLRQVAVFGEKLLDFLIAGRLQPVGQLVIGEVGLERIVAQGALVTAIGACIALGQGLLGLIVILALLAETGGGRIQANGRNEQAETQTGESAAHGTSVKRGALR